MAVSAWMDLIFEKEIQGATGASLHNTVRGRPNILVGDLQPCQGQFWDATEYVPPGCAGEVIIKDFLKWDECVPIHDVKLHWKVNEVKPTPRGFF